MGKFSYSLITLIFLLIQCSGPERKTDSVRVSGSADSMAIIFPDSADLPQRAPLQTSIDTCPAPLVVNIPIFRGGSYTVVYTTGKVKIDLLPPEIKLLPVSKEVLTKATIGNPEAQGIGFFTTYTTDNGLALDGITDGICDKAGYLWFSPRVEECRDMTENHLPILLLHKD
jgi:hypothetical protein